MALGGVTAEAAAILEVGVVGVLELETSEEEEEVRDMAMGAFKPSFLVQARGKGWGSGRNRT